MSASTNAVLKHWKKITFGAVVLTYSSSYAKNKYEEAEEKRKYCEIAKVYGQDPVAVNEKPRHVTVFLNPAAKDNTARQQFERYAAPLLHLAGLQVSVVKTEHEGQLKQLMEIIDKTDAVLIGGGDGSLLEAVTGLMRRTDIEEARQRPLGVIPVGKTNTMAHRFFPNFKPQAGWFGDAMMAVVKNEKKPFDVMHITGDQGKPVFAVHGLQWGPLRDAADRATKYWYLGPLKSKATYVFSSFKEWPQQVKAKLEYVLPCDGCSTCYKAPPPPPPKKWWDWQSMFLKPKPAVVAADYSQIQNEECGMWHSIDLETVCFTAATRNGLESEREKPPSLLLYISPNDLSRGQFIKHGMELERRPVGEIRTGSHDIQIAAREFKLTPVAQDSNSKQEWFFIDSEKYEAMPIHVQLMPRKINLFCSSAKS